MLPFMYKMKYQKDKLKTTKKKKQTPMETEKKWKWNSFK